VSTTNGPKKTQRTAHLPHRARTLYIFIEETNRQVYSRTFGAQSLQGEHNIVYNNKAWAPKVEVGKSNPNLWGWCFQGPSQDKSQDQLIVVDLMNLAYEGTLLGIQIEGLTCRSPP
jgi:hypothetical protein